MMLSTGSRAANKEKDHVISPCWLLFLGLFVLLKQSKNLRRERMKEEEKYNTTAAAAVTTATTNATLTTKFGEEKKRQKRKGAESNNNQIKYAYCRRRSWMVFDIDFNIAGICFEHWFIQWTSKCVCVCEFHFISFDFFFFSWIFSVLPFQFHCILVLFICYIVLFFHLTFAP